jgi:hypothetical protein
MENRLIYLAVETAEQQASQNEQDSNELKKTGAELAQLENLKAQSGGTKSATEARALIDDDKTPAAAKKILHEKIISVESAANARKLNLNPQTTEILDKAVASLKKSVDAQKTKKAEHASANSEFGKFASLMNAKELFKDVKVSMNSKTKGSVEISWDKFNSLEGFQQLGIEQKKAYLKALNDKLAGNTPEGSKAIDAILNKFKNDPRLPKNWRGENGYAGNPEKYGDTREHAAKWLMENADKKILQAETAFKFLEGNSHLLEKSGVKMPNKTDIFEKSTTEFNEYFEGIKQKIATVDQDMASSMEKMKVYEGAEMKNIETQNTVAIEEEKNRTEKTAEDLTPKLQQFIQDQKIPQEVIAKTEELKKQTQDVKEVDNVANLRAQAQAGEKTNWWKKLLGKQDAEADDYAQNQNKEIISEEVAEAEKESGKNFDPEALARKQVMGEKLANQKTADAFKKTLGVREGISAEDLNKLSALAMLQKTNVDSVKTALTPEVKRILEAQSADNYQTKIAA